MGMSLARRKERRGKRIDSGFKRPDGGKNIWITDFARSADVHSAGGRHFEETGQILGIGPRGLLDLR